MTIKVKKENSASSCRCSIDLEWNHNHPLKSLQVLTFREISPDTAEKIDNLFNQGLSPGEMDLLLTGWILKGNVIIAYSTFR